MAVSAAGSKNTRGIASADSAHGERFLRSAERISHAFRCPPALDCGKNFRGRRRHWRQSIRPRAREDFTRGVETFESRRQHSRSLHVSFHVFAKTSAQLLPPNPNELDSTRL